MNIGNLFIGGKWLEGDTRLESVDPSTGKILGHFCEASQKDVDAAIVAARDAFPIWRNLPIAKRASILDNAAGLLIKRYGEEGKPTELKSLIAKEVGKRLPEADIEVIESSDMLAYFANKGPDILEPRTLRLNKKLWPTKKSYVLFEPIGVVGVISPWNYPLELPIWAIGPALLAGNTVVFKPSEHSTFVGLEIGKILEEAGLPPGVLNIVTGAGKAGKMIVQHDNVDMISFTGSVAVGRQIAIECANRFKKYTLELSGNDAAIVEPDADLELTANGLVWGAFCNSGQVCVGVKRAFIAKEVFKDLTRLIIDRTVKLRPGIDYGPIISKKQLSKIVDQLDDALAKGAQLLSGGKRLENHRGFYFPPTVVTNITRDMNIMKEECFGPLLPLIPVEVTDEAIELANESQYGLGASIWTSNRSKGEIIASKLEVGMAWINDVNVAFPEAPWRGIKQSGVGVELSEWGVLEYVSIKHVNIETSDNVRREWWFPYSIH